MIDQKIAKNFLDKHGRTNAIILIQAATGQSFSFAEQIASGRYRHRPTKLVREALADLFKVKESTLFPPSNEKAVS